MPFYPDSEFQDDFLEAFWNTLHASAARKLGRYMVGHSSILGSGAIVVKP